MRLQLDHRRQRVAATAGTVALAGLAASATRRRRGRAPSIRYARDVMTRPVQSIASEATVAQAAERFAEAGVGVLPVCRDGDWLVGVLTDRDLVVRVLAQGEDPVRFPVAECADPEPITATENETLESLRARMQEGGVRRIPVVRHGRVVGIVGPSDLEHTNARPSRLVQGLARLRDDHRSARWLFERGYRPGALGRARIDERRRRAADAALAHHIQELRPKA
jgi:CBS domain-containing protein